MADDPELPWIFPYRPDPTLPADDGREALRPVLDVTFDGLGVWTPALVDSGSRFNLAAHWIARGLGIRLDDPEHCRRIRIGGSTHLFSFHEVTIGIRRHLSTGDPHHGWTAPVGFLKDDWDIPWMVLGQIGFFDRFTVSMQAEVGAVVLEAPSTFTERFPGAATLP